MHKKKIVFSVYLKLQVRETTHIYEEALRILVQGIYGHRVLALTASFSLYKAITTRLLW